MRKRTTRELLDIADTIIGKMAKWGDPSEVEWNGYEVGALIVELRDEGKRLLKSRERLLKSRDRWKNSCADALDYADKAENEVERLRKLTADLSQQDVIRKQEVE